MGFQIRPGELLGRALGWLIAPAAAAGSLARRARVLHPDGLVYEAEVIPLAHEPALEGVAQRLAGPALVRLSSALWRGGKERMDVLGLAVRFLTRVKGDDAARALDDDRGRAAAEGGDQDVLFATIRSPWTTPLAPLTTNIKSFLANDYYGVSPFEVVGLGRVKLRLAGPRGRELAALRGDDDDRARELLRAAERGSARFRLEALRPGFGARYEPIAEIQLIRSVGDAIDQDALRFSPFRTGRGLVPVGFVHALRRGVYTMSQLARPSRDARVARSERGSASQARQAGGVEQAGSEARRPFARANQAAQASTSG